MPRLFDVYLVIDWSARSRPSPPRPVADAVWIGERLADAPAGVETYWRTRAAAVEHLQARLAAHVAAGRRVLVGWDFPFGYPAGFAAAVSLPGPGPPWRRVWRALAAWIVDDAHNRNNRFAVAARLNARLGVAPPGPFWGAAGAPPPGLARTSPFRAWAAAGGGPVARLRWVDRGLLVQEVWKLVGVGSVGSQALLGIPWVHRVRHAPPLAAVSAVWPFETGFAPGHAGRVGPFVLHAEVWPGVLPRAAVAAAVAAGALKDQAQVRLLGAALAARDAAGTLGAWLGPPTGLAGAAVRSILQEEGWILGAPASPRRSQLTVSVPTMPASLWPGSEQ